MPLPHPHQPHAHSQLRASPRLAITDRQAEGEDARTDRREEPRRSAELSCKLRPAHALRFLSARTENVSATGAMLTVDCAKPLGAGDALELGIAFEDRPLLRTGDIVRATVVRVMPTLGDRQRIAVRFGSRVQAAAVKTLPDEQVAAA